MWRYHTHSYSKHWKDSLRTFLPRAIVASTFCFTLITWFGQLASAGSRADFPCTNEEKWIFSNRVPKTLIASLEEIKHKKEDSLETLKKGYELQATATYPELRMIAEYFIYRGYYDMGLIHFAYRGLNAVAMSPSNPETDGVRLAALGCLNRIHRQIPSLQLAPALTNAFGRVDFRAIWPDQRKQLADAILTITLRKFSDSGRNADTTQEMRILENARPVHYILLAKINQAAVQGNETNVIFYADQLLRMPKLPESLENQKDYIRLTLARTLYNQGNYQKAIKLFNEVSQDSNLLAQAILGKAWAHCVLENASDSLSGAYNLIYGDLKNTFIPDASVIAGITLFENCHYAEAFQSVKHFRKTYDPSYRWLYNWYTRESQTPEGKNLYRFIIQHMTGKHKTGVPANIMSEWLRSPIFLGWQQELNTLLDEKKVAEEMYAKLKDPRAIAGRSKRGTVILNGIRGFVLSFMDEIPRLQQKLIDGINHELVFINRHLITRWAEAYENTQMLQVEIYSATGESIIKKDVIAADTYGEKDSKKIKRDKEGLPVLDWGKFSTDNEQENETWQDEVGDLTTKLSNICVKKTQ